MPQYNVKTPDGKYIPVNAPEGSTEQDAIAFVASTWKPQEPSQTSVMDNYDAQGNPSALKQELEGESWLGRQAAGLGVAPAKLYYGAKQLIKGGTLSSEDQQAVKDWSTIEQDAMPGAVAGNIGAMYLGGRALSSIPSLAKVGSSLLLPKTAMQAAGAGAGYSALQPTEEQGQAGLMQRGVEAGKGALAALAGYGLAKGLGKVLNPEMAKANPVDEYAQQVQLLKQEGIPTTMGQKLGGAARITESKLTSTPAVGDLIGWRQGQGIDKLNEAAYKRALSPIGEKSTQPVGYKGVEEVHSKLTKAYADLTGKMDFKPDAQFGRSLQTVKTMVDELPEQYSKSFDKLLNRIVVSRATPQGNMAGETLKSVESELSEEISALTKSGGYEHVKMANALQEVQSSIRQNLARQNPEWASQLAKVNEGWANYAVIRDAAAAASGRRGGAFTPANLAAAVSANAKRQGGQAIGKAKIGEGRALMQDLSSAAENVLAPAYPDSGTAGRALPWATGLAVSGGAAASGTAVPLAVLTGLGSLPYLPGTSQLTNALMASRPAIVQRAGNKLSELAPYGGLLGLGMAQ